MGYARIAAGAIKRGDYSGIPPDLRIYEKSIFMTGDLTLAMIRAGGTGYLLAFGAGPHYDGLPGREEDGCKLCPLDTRLRKALQRVAPFTRPVSCGPGRASMGLGDRLGIATGGHIRSIAGRDVFPVFAQQSIRELTLTGRDYEEVLNDVAFAVFRHGYREGYGADADHLKTAADVSAALSMGFSMITLDCSEKIDTSVEGLNAAAVSERYAGLDPALRARYESRYLDCSFEVGKAGLTFPHGELARCVLIYHHAIEYVREIYRDCFAPAAVKPDLEVSIDETSAPTTPAAHFFVARELTESGVEPAGMAPRFTGEFQKGIDYRGDMGRFERDLAVHAAITDRFGYRLSVHSGSDKFSVFPLIGKHTSGRFHVKTSGTSWLEALRVVAERNPELYRRMHRHAIERFDESRKLYHVTADIGAMAPIDSVKDPDLARYLDDDNARQLLHISYGQVLSSRGADGAFLFRSELYSTLAAHEEAYAEKLARHIGRHITALGK